MRAPASALLTLYAAVFLAACEHLPTAPPNPPNNASIEAAIAYHHAQALRLRGEGRLSSALRHWQILKLLDPARDEFQQKWADTQAARAEALKQQLQRAREALRRQDNTRAQQALLNVLALDPDHSDAQNLLRDIERQRIVSVQAERAARSRPPTLPRTTRETDKASEEGRLYDYEQSFAAVRDAEPASAVEAGRRYLATQAQDTAGRQSLAEQAYKRAKQMAAQNQGEQALPLYELAMRLHPATPKPWRTQLAQLHRNLAQADLAKGKRAFGQNLGQAIEHWECCLNHDPWQAECSQRLNEARRIQQQLQQIKAPNNAR